VRQLLAGQEGVGELRELQRNMQTMGISGVPFFIVNDQYGISGAQPSEVLISQFKQVLQMHQEME